MKIQLTLILILCTLSSYSQLASTENKNENNSEVLHKWRISLPSFIVTDRIGKNFGGWNNRTSTQMIELHAKRNLDNKNIIGVKFATWRLFQPMGIKWWDGLLDKLETESEFYPGHLRETGIGISYQRMLWKGLFASVEVLPQFQTYTDLEGNKIKNGFKVYNSYHLGYHVSLGKKKRFFLEPQVHCNQWMFDNNSPEGFKELDSKWGNIFMFEPNLYVGINF